MKNKRREAETQILIRNSIMESLNHDEDKYYSIMQQTRQLNIVAEKWKMFKILKDKGYKQNAIARHFGMHPTAIHNAIKKLTPYPKESEFSEISDALIVELKDKTNRSSKALYFELNNMGYSQTLIAKTFNISQKKVCVDIRKYLKHRAFLKRRSEIIKFR